MSNIGPKRSDIKLTLLLPLAFATIASGHFVWVVPQGDGLTAQVMISEDLKPGSDVDAAMVAGAKLSLRDGSGHETALAVRKGSEAYVTSIPGSGGRLIHGVADLGVMTGAQGKTYVLIYYPKTIIGDAFTAGSIVGDAAPVEIVPVRKGEELRLQVLAHGKPLAKTEVTVIFPDGTQKKLTADAAGETEPLTQTGRYGAWARFWEPVSGEREGKAYGETRNYATLVFDLPVKRFATLPQTASSFGGVASGGWLYVYGGHIAKTHAYSTETVSGQFARMKLTGGAWEPLPNGRALQGMNLAALGGKIYLVGGMEPRNKPGTPSATFSVADCARFDPATMKWEALPPLPAPRSSHDVVAIGNQLIVTGGWTLKGPATTEWLDTLEVMDVSAAKLEWKSLKQPFRRRALIAAAYSGKMFVMGGFDEQGNISRDVAIYDPKTGVWTKGPDLPAGENSGFAPAACVHEGHLYVSVADGGLYRLNDANNAWEKRGSSTPRLAHRIVSNGKSILVIGGSEEGKTSDSIQPVTP
jgi:N-acetylneuraminic acid mutarotase